MLRGEARDRGRLEQDEAEQRSDEDHLPLLAVRLAAVEHHQHPEDAQHQRVAQQRAEHAAYRAAGGRAAPHEVIVQRGQFLVGFVGHDLVGAHDPVPGPDDVLAGIDTAAELVATPLRLERVQHQGGPVEVARQSDVHRIPDARPLVGVGRAGAAEILLVGEHLVARHRRFGRPPPDDQLGRLLHLQHPGGRDAKRQGAVEQFGQRLLEAATLAALGEVRGFGLGQDHTLLLRHPGHRLWAALVGGILDAGEKGVQRDRGTVEGALLELVDGFDRAGELLGFPRELLIRLVDREGEQRDHFVIGDRARLEQRGHVARARGERQIGEQRQRRHPDPAHPVIAHLLLGGEVHLSPERPRRRRG